MIENTSALRILIYLGFFSRKFSETENKNSLINKEQNF